VRASTFRVLPWLGLGGAILISTSCSNSLFDGSATNDGGSTLLDDGAVVLDDGAIAPRPDANPAACFELPTITSGTTQGILSETGSNVLHSGCSNGLPDEDGTETIYKLTLSEPGDIRLSVVGTTDSPDTVIALFTDCGAGATEIMCADNPDQLEYRDAPAGTYYVVVEGYNALDLGGYRLDVETVGLLAQGVSCDDAATDTRCDTGLLCSPSSTTCESADTLVEIEFTTSIAPATVVDANNGGPVWDLCSQTFGCNGNETGSASGGNSAMVSDDAFVAANREELHTPSIDAGAFGKVVLTFDQYFYEWFDCNDAGFIEVTTNGGQSYTTIDTLLEVRQGHSEYDISTQVAGQIFSARFVYDDDTVNANCSAQSWQIDDIIVRGL